MTPRSEVRLGLNQGQLALLLRCVREASAAGLLRFDEVAEVGDLVALLGSKLPSASAVHPAGWVAGSALLEDAILRVLCRAEDEGRSRLHSDEIDVRLVE